MAADRLRWAGQAVLKIQGRRSGRAAALAAPAAWAVSWRWVPAAVFVCGLLPLPSPSTADGQRPEIQAGALASITVTDDSGRRLHWVQPPRRIVSLLPSLTEVVFALGAGDRVVGVGQFDDWPPAVAQLPRLGGIDDARLEPLLALRPDVVLASTSSRALERLERFGLTVLRLKSDTHADVERSIRTVAQLLGDAAAGERLWQRIQAEMRAARDRVPAAARGESVYFEIGGGPYAAGAGSYIGQTLSRLGLNNIAPAELGPFPRLNPEFVLRQQPQWVMGAASDLRDLPRRPGWAGLPAVVRQQVCAFAPQGYNLLVRPGPRMGQGAALLADCLSRGGRPR